MKQNIVLIPSKTNMGYDTLFLSTSNDPLLVNIDGEYNLEIPDKKIIVETPGKDWFDYTLGTITIIGAIIASFYTWKSIRKLYQKDEDKQTQFYCGKNGSTKCNFGRGEFVDFKTGGCSTESHDWFK